MVAFNENGILVVDNVVSEDEVYFIKKGITHLPLTNDNEELYIWNSYFTPEDKNLIPDRLVSIVVNDIQNRITSLMKEHLGIENFLPTFTGVAISSKGFDYHADAEWPEESSKRFMGTPTLEQNYSTFIDYSKDGSGMDKKLCRK